MCIELPGRSLVRSGANSFLRLTVLLLTCGAAVTMAQTAQVNGRVTDPSGQSVAGASIVVTNTGTGVNREAKSNEEGLYLVPGLIPGTYSLRATKEGFKTVSQTNIPLTVDTRTRIDLHLELGSISEAVTVTASPDDLQVDSPEVSTTVLSQQYESLPLVQLGRVRTASTFVYLAPGVQGDVRVDGADNVAATNQISVHGGLKGQNEVWLDGLPAGPMSLSGAFNESSPGVEAMREFKIQTSQLAADYGHTAHAVTSFVLKSGTNKLHGAAFEYFRNNKLDARNFFAAERALTRQNEFGASIGGPVVLPKLYNGRDRTFFFFAWTSARRRGMDNFKKAQIPTQANVEGDFSSVVNAAGKAVAIYDPYSTRSDGKSGFTRDSFPENIIPKSRFDSVGYAIMKLYPAPNLSSTLNYGAYTGEAKLDPNIYTARLDHSFSMANKLFYSFNVTDIPRLRYDAAIPGPLATGIDQRIGSQTHRLGVDSILRPTLMNSFVMGLNRYKNPVEPVVNEKGWPTKLGLKGVYTDYFPTVSFTDDYTDLGSSTISKSLETTYLFKDTMSWTKGAMTFRFGGEYRWTHSDGMNFASSQGSFSFSPNATKYPGGSGGNSIASLLLGVPNTGSIRVPTGIGTRRSYSGFFVQNDYRVNNRLTINAGLRFEYMGAPFENHDRYSRVDLNTANPGAGNLPGAVIYAGKGTGRTGKRTLTDVDYSGWGPRIGGAYRIGNRTVLRGGIGIYYADNYLGVTSYGFAVTRTFTTPDTGITAPFYLKDGIPQNYSTEPTIDATIQNGQTGTYVDSSTAQLPRTRSWSIGIQHTLGKSLTLEANYIGNRATRQSSSDMVNINQVDAKYLSLGQTLQKNITTSEAKAAGIVAPYEGFTGTVAQALRPYPQFLTLTSAEAKVANLIYHAGEFRLRKRFSSGFSFEGNYTWSKVIGLNSTSYVGYGAASNVLQDNGNPGLERSILPNDVPHKVVVHYTYTLPFQGRGVSRQALGGWNVSAVQRYQSGYPVAMLMSNSLPVFNRTLRPDLAAGMSPSSGIGDGDFDPGRGDRVTNVSAFSNPVKNGVYRFGTAPPTSGDLRNFPVLREDVTFSKEFHLREKLPLKFQCQVFNLFNRHRFTAITTNFSSAAFGQTSSASLPRFIQLGLRLSF